MTDEATDKLGLHNIRKKNALFNSCLEYIRLKWNKIKKIMTITEFLHIFRLFAKKKTM